jgi:hypothetical protein
VSDTPRENVEKPCWRLFRTDRICRVEDIHSDGEYLLYGQREWDRLVQTRAVPSNVIGPSGNERPVNSTDMPGIWKQGAMGSDENSSKQMQLVWPRCQRHKLQNEQTLMNRTRERATLIAAPARLTTVNNRSRFPERGRPLCLAATASRSRAWSCALRLEWVLGLEHGRWKQCG